MQGQAMSDGVRLFPDRGIDGGFSEPPATPEWSRHLARTSSCLRWLHLSVSPSMRGQGLTKMAAGLHWVQSACVSVADRHSASLSMQPAQARADAGNGAWCWAMVRWAGMVIVRKQPARLYLVLTALACICCPECPHHCATAIASLTSGKFFTPSIFYPRTCHSMSQTRQNTD